MSTSSSVSNHLLYSSVESIKTFNTTRRRPFQVQVGLLGSAALIMAIYGDVALLSSPCSLKSPYMEHALGHATASQLHGLSSSIYGHGRALAGYT